MMDMDLGAMADLHAEDVRYLVYHTLGPMRDGAPVDLDQSAAEINRYHKSLGWSGIGYHFVVRKNGSVELGRPVGKVGAHCLGLNDKGLGIAFSGHGDIAPLTPAQFQAGVNLGAMLTRIYEVPIEHNIGHREVNELVEEGVLSSRFRTPKSCPGVRVSMRKVRLAIAMRLYPPPEPIAIEWPDDLAA